MDSPGLLRALRRHAPLVGAVTLAALVIAIVVAALIPRTYTAQATLFLRVKAASTSLYERSQFGLQRIRSYPELIDSPAVLRTVIAATDLDTTPQALARRVSAVNPASTALLNVTASASTPQEAADIANAASVALADDVNALEDTQTTSKNAVSLVQQVAAQAPVGASSPNVPGIIGLGLFGGLVLGLLAALALERFRPRLRTAADVRRVTGLPLLAQLPGARTPPQTSRLDAAALTAVTNLTALGRGRIAPVLLLAPAGRSLEQPTVRFAVARALARTGRSVIVVETRQQTGETSGPGTAELLAAATTVKEAAVRNGDGVDVLPAGDENAISPSFELDQRFDAALRPILADHDVAVLQASIGDGRIDLAIVAPAARAAVVVASRRTSTEHEVRRVLAALRALNVLPIGVVLTDGPEIGMLDLATTWIDADFVRIEGIEPAPRTDVALVSPRAPRRAQPMSAVDPRSAGTARSDR